MNKQTLERDTLISSEENREMFNSIAKNYDATNRAISWGMDRSWRRKTIHQLRPFKGGRYLDLGTGTGDLVFEILRQSNEVFVDGVDPSEAMLRIAKEKAKRRGLTDEVSFFAADAMALPMPDKMYDGVVTGFCLRNIEFRVKALTEVFRLLKPGGQFIVLEATYPIRPWVRWGYRRCIPWVPRVGKLFGGGTAYTYLVDSIEGFLTPDEVMKMLRSAGFSEIGHQALLFGTISIFSGIKCDE